jgi:hypothetical protein
VDVVGLFGIEMRWEVGGEGRGVGEGLWKERECLG